MLQLNAQGAKHSDMALKLEDAKHQLADKQKQVDEAMEKLRHKDDKFNSLAESLKYVL